MAQAIRDWGSTRARTRRFMIWFTVTLQNVCDTSSAQSLLLTVEKYQVAESHSGQRAVIEQNDQIIKQQMDRIAMQQDQKKPAKAEVGEL